MRDAVRRDAESRIRIWDVDAIQNFRKYLIWTSHTQLRYHVTSAAFVQASYPCGNFSDSSSVKFRLAKGSIGHAFAVCIRTDNQNQASFSAFGPHEISVLIELTLGHLRYHLTDVPPQPNSPPDYVFRTDQPSKKTTLNPKLAVMQVSV